ncbi:hypothetical protein [Sphingobium sp.]|uniref:hypothetical protein n=1 Tax=Sphingobium sp. TaxID=1912891 RepID=UPI0035C68301
MQPEPDLSPEPAIAPAPVSAPDVALEFGDDLWFIAVRKDEPHPTFTYRRLDPGYASPVHAIDAAIQYALKYDLTVASRVEMIEEVEETLAFFAADARGLVE